MRKSTRVSLGRLAAVRTMLNTLMLLKQCSGLAKGLPLPSEKRCQKNPTPQHTIDDGVTYYGKNDGEAKDRDNEHRHRNRQPAIDVPGKEWAQQGDALHVTHCIISKALPTV